MFSKLPDLKLEQKASCKSQPKKFLKLCFFDFDCEKTSMLALHITINYLS